MNKNILLIVQNNSFPFDKRIFREATTLMEDDNNIFVICPQSMHDKEAVANINEICVRRYKDYIANGRIGGYIFEYLNSISRIYFHLNLDSSN